MSIVYLMFIHLLQLGRLVVLFFFVMKFLLRVNVMYVGGFFFQLLVEITWCGFKC